MNINKNQKNLKFAKNVHRANSNRVALANVSHKHKNNTKRIKNATKHTTTLHLSLKQLLEMLDQLTDFICQISSLFHQQINVAFI